MKAARVGYIRVSSSDQNTARQEKNLKSMNLDRIFIDEYSGKNLDRPEFKRMLDFLRDGDELYVCSMDRLARNLKDLLTVISQLKDNGISLYFLKEGISLKPYGESSPMTNLLISMMGAVAEFERTLIRERQMEGISIAKAKGIYKGRKPIDKQLINRADDLIKQGIPLSKVSRELKISRSTLYRRIKNIRAA